MTILDIQARIDAAQAAGGGTVPLPPGVFECSPFEIRRLPATPYGPPVRLLGASPTYGRFAATVLRFTSAEVNATPRQACAVISATGASIEGVAIEAISTADKPAIGVLIRAHAGRCDREGRDEPFVWLALVKFDGESFKLIDDGSDASTSFVQVLASAGGHGNLGNLSVPTGTVLPIPQEVKTFMSIRLRSVGGLDPTDALARQLPTLGLIAVAWEEESTTSDHDIRIAHRAFVSELQSQLNGLIASLIPSVLTAGAIDTSALAAGLDPVGVNVARRIMDTLFDEGDDFPDIITAGIDPDRFIGFGFQRFSLAALASPDVGGATIRPFSLELRRPGERSVYTITGRIEVAHSPRRLFERSDGYSVPQLEGYVFDPDRPAPPNTVPLRRWYSEERDDSFTTSNPEFANRCATRSARTTV